MNARIIQLEETIAHQSVEIEQLSHELHMQQKELSALKAQLEKLGERVQGLQEEDDRYNIPEPPPPHY